MAQPKYRSLTPPPPPNWIHPHLLGGLKEAFAIYAFAILSTSSYSELAQMIYQSKQTITLGAVRSETILFVQVFTVQEIWFY